MTVSITALILAGGKSSRMGQDKALIPWDGTPLLRRVCDVALSCCSSVYILTPHPDCYRSIVPSECHFLLEANPGQGPLVALANGLEQLPAANWVWLLACDLPRLQVSVVQGWIARLADVPTATLAVVPYRKDINSFEPLCGFYRPEIKTDLKAFQQTGKRSFQSFLRHSAVCPLPLSEAEILTLWNCNSPADLR
jgi:molybdopterin-guanine dinucleotide biosynthesis protein A